MINSVISESQNLGGVVQAAHQIFYKHCIDELFEHDPPGSTRSYANI